MDEGFRVFINRGVFLLPNVISPTVPEASLEVAEQTKPFAAQIDESDAIPVQIRDLLWSKGLLSLLPIAEGVPKNLKTETLCEAVLEVSRVSAAIGLLVIVQAVGTLPVALAGTPEQRRFFAAEIGRKKYLAFALT